MVWLIADVSVRVDGTINAGGDNQYTAANAVGGILLVSPSFSGSGTLRAKGGSSDLGSWGRAGGGGGRVAILRADRFGYERARMGQMGQFRADDLPDDWASRVFVDGGQSYSKTGGVGTVVYYIAEPPTGLMVEIF